MPFGYIREKYEQSRKRLEELKQKFKVGSYVQYGHYPQEKGGTDSTPIEWLVLEQKGCKALLISRYALDAKPYNKTAPRKGVTWETCTLRKWLNKDFIKAAFDVKEQGSVLITAVDNSKSQGNPKHDTDGGNNTFDRIFLLSYTEADKYFEENEDRQCASTEHAIEHGASVGSYQVDGKPAGYWWLRSPGRQSNYASIVHSDGSLIRSNVNNPYGSVRPAFWLNLESL